MNLDVMRTFCDLVDTGSFTRAAEANFISQSAVSQQLAKLERDLGTQLITRGGGMVTPTEAGKAFYRGAHEIIRRYEGLLGEVRSASDAIRGVLRIGTIYSVGFYMFNPYVREFLQAHPEVDLHVEYTQWTHIYAAVIGGEMDLGVVACPEKQRSIEIIPIGAEELVLICSPDHRFARRKTVDVQELNGETMIGFDANTPTRRHIEKVLKRNRVEVRIAMEFDNVELLKRAVEVGGSLAILPPGNVEREVEYGDLCFARFRDSRPWTRKLGILRRRGKMPSPAESKFLALLRKRV